MIVQEVLDRFLSGVKGQALREGTRHARQARVGVFAGTQESVSSAVRGQTGDYDVALWHSGGRQDAAPIETSTPAQGPQRGHGPEPLHIDPLALSAAMAGIAPALPPDHRRSLAAVFRVLAESLESS